MSYTELALRIIAAWYLIAMVIAVAFMIVTMRK